VRHHGGRDGVAGVVAVMTTLLDLPPRRHDTAFRAYASKIRERAGICAAAVADELGITERTVVKIQRRLGLRPCRNPRDDD